MFWHRLKNKSNIQTSIECQPYQNGFIQTWPASSLLWPLWPLRLGRENPPLRITEWPGHPRGSELPVPGCNPLQCWYAFFIWSSESLKVASLVGLLGLDNFLYFFLKSINMYLKKKKLISGHTYGSNSCWWWCWEISESTNVYIALLFEEVFWWKWVDLYVTYAPL